MNLEAKAFLKDSDQTHVCDYHACIRINQLIQLIIQCDGNYCFVLLD